MTAVGERPVPETGNPHLEGCSAPIDDAFATLQLVP
jgi:hypothetical protein